jgi:hypothetical protein
MRAYSGSEVRPLTLAHLCAIYERYGTIPEKPRIPFGVNKPGSSPCGSEVRPLTLAHLCAIYERYGTIPEKPRTVYRRIIRLLLEEWDEQRSVRRFSKYAGFEVDRKEEFLQSLSYQITFNFKVHRFTHQQLEECYQRIYKAFGLPQGEVKHVVREVESHTGLIVEAAYDTYEFAHKSLQEYLAASFIVKLPELPTQLRHFPHEAALAVALSSHPTKYLTIILRNAATWSAAEFAQFSEIFIRRMWIERVDFVESDSLGVHILWLYWRKYHYTKTEAKERDRESFFQFVQLKPVIDSVAAVFEKSQIHPVSSDPDQYEIHLPSSHGHLTPTKKTEKLLLDRQFVDVVRTRMTEIKDQEE